MNLVLSTTRREYSVFPEPSLTPHMTLSAYLTAFNAEVSDAEV